jgi:selenide,water dikinase
VFRLDAERALVQTTDFFPPIVDDPRWFGRIAAANALSDVYAMGGRALTALNIVGWPAELDVDILGEILAGGMDKIREAGAALCGGHTVNDSEIKYGLAVTGLVHPDRFWRNSGARAGDVLLLTKPLGMGTVSTAIKTRVLRGDDPAVLRAMEQMATLNLGAAEAVADLDVHGATDVTGFGLIGHSFEMADGAKLLLTIDVEAVPFFEGALELARKGSLSGGCKRGRKAYGARVEIPKGLDATRVEALFDAETSGGLLLAVAPRDAETVARRLRDAGCLSSALIGEFGAPAADGIRIRLRGARSSR